MIPVVLSPGYSGKSNEKGKPSTGKPGPSLGFMGYLHNFLIGISIIQTIWLNLISHTAIDEMPQFQGGLGIVPWEQMPVGEICAVAHGLQQSLMGRLVPLCRFLLLADDGIHYSEGIFHTSHKEGGYDPSIAVNNSKEAKAIWVNPEKRPWRELTSLLSFVNAEGSSLFDCVQLRLCIPRVCKFITDFRLWSGGLRVSSNAGEQYVSGSDDFVESEIKLSVDWLGRTWFMQLKAEMEILEEINKVVFGSINGYFRHQKSDGKSQAAAATNLFWQLCGNKIQDLVNACGADDNKDLMAIRLLLVGYANRAFNAFCPRETPRQIEAWASNRPNLGKFVSKNQ